jgi:acetyl-CoA acetyltransferase
VKGSADSAVVGVGGTEVVRRTDEPLLALAVRAAHEAVTDAGLELADIDGYVGSPVAPNASAVHQDGVDEVSAPLLTRALGLRASWTTDVAGMIGTAVATAALAVAHGVCRHALVVRAVYNPTRGRYSEVSARQVAGAEQFTLPYGIGPAGGRHAQWYSRYAHDWGATREDLYRVVALDRAHAQQNPVAYWRGKPLSMAEYLAARWIAEPLCLYDCDIPVTSAVALVVTSARAAAGRPHAAYLHGFSQGSRPEAAFDMAAITPAEVDVSQIYDGFSPFAFLWLERLGFCAEGSAFRRLREGLGTVDSAMPINTFGGSLGEGRLHGMGHVREAVYQAMGRAAARQVPNVRFSLAHVGIPERSCTLIFGSTRR